MVFYHEANDSLACWVEEAHGNQSKGYKILEVERGGGAGGGESNQCRSRRCAKKAKILQAGKKRGRGSL
jgi:hypothetical protein